MILLPQLHNLKALCEKWHMCGFSFKQTVWHWWNQAFINFTHFNNSWTKNWKKKIVEFTFFCVKSKRFAFKTYNKHSNPTAESGILFTGCSKNLGSEHSKNPPPNIVGIDTVESSFIRIDIANRFRIVNRKRVKDIHI